MPRGTEFQYMVGVFPPQLFTPLPINLPMKRCWGDDVSWLKSIWCLPKGLKYGFGFWVDFVRNVIGACVRPANEQVAGGGPLARACYGLATIRAYLHLLLSIFWSNISRLILMSCSIYTEDILSSTTPPATSSRSRRAVSRGTAWRCTCGTSPAPRRITSS